MDATNFDEFFRLATGGIDPFPYQRRLAEAADWPARIEVPTGLGKTLAILTAWLWRRRPEHPGRAATPRRLIYCLPMRVLVEQTRDVAAEVCRRVGVASRIVVLMGGVDDASDWDTQPEADVILIGTQDMLLSRALNRGYGMSRYRWPLHFGLLNNDCLWLIDEVQLIGSGLATTAQLQALRRKLGAFGRPSTSWMSATMEDQWLKTVDVEEVDLAGRLSLAAADLAVPEVARRTGARKQAQAAESTMGDAKAVAAEILAAHRAATRTLAIFNTVERARDVFNHLRRSNPSAALVLLHSRFRAADREQAMARASAAPGPVGTIVVSTQVIEAGVDLSSATMFTEIAPWASLVQRFGRCNRRGEEPEARVRWIKLPDDAKRRAKLDKPYALAELEASQHTLIDLADVGPAALPRRTLSFERGLVLRRRDLVDLFDTTPDLMGNDVDVSRFIRDADDHDLRVCWRDFEGQPDRAQPSPTRAELCAVPIGVVRKWAEGTRARSMWEWDPLTGVYRQPERLYPGLTILMPAAAGGYDPAVGLDPESKAFVPPVAADAPAREEDREYEGDPESEWQCWYTLRRHSEDVATEARAVATAIGLPKALADAVVTAGRWHDAGKAHPTWQAAAKRLGADPPQDLVAKSNAMGRRLHYEDRPGFRHELASALLALTHGQADLVCYLIACHHGKVRMSLRSLPHERAPRGTDGQPDPTIRHARGIWEGDHVPEADLGDGTVVPATTLTLSYMELGEHERTGPSWLARVLALRDAPELGPFRLAFLEGLVKAADERASRRAADVGGQP